MLMSVLQGLISVFSIARIPLDPIDAAAMLAILSMLMGMAVMTLMSVHWMLTCVPRIVRTQSVPILVAVEQGID